MNLFERAFQLVVGLEGAYSDDPLDAGGQTKFGISKRAYPQLDIENLTLTDAQIIYFRDYWTPAKCCQLPPVLAVLVFDCAVNQGVTAAVKVLEKTLGIQIDGIVGDKVLSAVRAYSDQGELTSLFLADRALRYTQTHGFDHDGRGWLKRLFKIQASAWQMFSNN